VDLKALETSSPPLVLLVCFCVGSIDYGEQAPAFGQTTPHPTTTSSRFLPQLPQEALSLFAVNMFTVFEEGQAL